MAKEITSKAMSLFENIKQYDENGNEFWTARQLSKLLEYSEYRHFLPVIERAKEACKNSGQKLTDHFEDILEMINLAKTAKRKMKNVRICSYATITSVDNKKSIN